MKTEGDRERMRWKIVRKIKIKNVACVHGDAILVCYFRVGVSARERENKQD